MQIIKFEFLEVLVLIYLVQSTYGLFRSWDTENLSF